jgi:PAS domain S-box-containing protein
MKMGTDGLPVILTIFFLLTQNIMQDLLRTLIDTLPDYIYVKDTKSRFLLANKATAQAMGAISPDELIGKTDFDYYPKELAEQYYATEQTIIATEQPMFNEEVQVFDQQSESLIWVIVSKVPFYDDQGNIAGIVGMNRDITERKRTEEELHRLNKKLLAEKGKLENIVRGIGAGLSLLDSETRIVWANEILQGWFGPIEKIGGRPCYELYELKDPQKECSALRTLHSGQMERGEAFAYNTQSEKRYFQLITVPLKDEDGRIIQIVELTQDITERKQTEEALRESEEKYRILVEHSLQGIIVWQEGKFVFVNEAFTQMIGYSTEKLLRMSGESLFQFIYPEDRQMVRQRMQSRLTGENVLSKYDMRMIRSDGELRWFEQFAIKVRWKGKPALRSVLIDITERKHYENDLRKQLQATSTERYKFGSLIGKSPAMQKVYELITKAAVSDASVMIMGESGTGKELIAQTIHEMSKRKDKPFMPVNCGAVPADLMESTFFGHKKGAFTGANQDKKGMFDVAHQGVLFLDEVSEIPLSSQVKLLRAIEGRGYIPIGDHAVRYADVRIIAATNRNLEELLEQGLMRKDFFYRLNVIPITIPPLRERKEDIPLLIEHFVRQFGRKLQELPGRVIGYFYSHDWPGNVRQLQNAVQRYFALGFINEIPPDTNSLWEAVEMLEKQMILDALELYQGHKKKAAEYLQIPARTLRRKMKKYHID